MTSRTPTAARRSGDDYQDLIAIEVMLDFMKHPSRYQWIRLEAAEAGRLDDVVALQTSGLVTARQVKFSTDPERAGDQLSWERLLHQRQGRRGPLPSYLQVWDQSLLRLESQFDAVEPYLITNRQPAVGFDVQPDGLVNIEAIPPATLKEIHSQLGDDRAMPFLNTFRFKVDEQGMADLEERLRRQFELLGGTTDGWHALKNRVRAWISGRPSPANGEIRLLDIREAAEWARLQPLPQGLEIPADYTLPNQSFHEAILGLIASQQDRCVVLTAEAGQGKSTYLSYLVKALTESNVPVIRHHYFLSVQDGTPGRLDHRRIAQSLMSEIEARFEEELGERGRENPDPHRLRDWVEECGRNLRESGQTLVIIVDGLDHVWRETKSREELRQLFDYLLPVPQGVTVVVGTQPIPDEQLPPALLAHAPRDRWIELPRLDQQAVAEWLDRHAQEIRPEAGALQDWERGTLSEAFFSKTGGHPLLLRYSLERLRVKGVLITAPAVEDLQPAATDSVSEYYNTLWRALDQAGKDALALLSLTRFVWPANGLTQCLQSVGYGAGEAATVVRDIRHLLAPGDLGVQVFHSSLHAFVRQQGTFADRRVPLLRAAIDWLSTRAPAFWKRAHLWLLQAEAGDTAPLVNGPNRDWVVDGLVAGHPLDQMAELLMQSAHVALRERNFARFVECGLLSDYVWAAREFQEETNALLLTSQLYLSADEYLLARTMSELLSRNDLEIRGVAWHAARSGLTKELDRCFNEIVRRVNRPGGAEPNGNFELAERYRTLMEVVALANSSPDGAIRFFTSFQQMEDQEHHADEWASAARRGRKVATLREALSHDMPTRCRDRLSHHLVELALEEAVSLDGDSQELLSPLCREIYRVSRGEVVDLTQVEPPQLQKSDAQFSYEAGPRLSRNYFHSVFHYILLQELAGDADPRSRLSAVSDAWTEQATDRLSYAARGIARAIQTGDFDVAAIYRAMEGLSIPTFSESWLQRERVNGLRGALAWVTVDLLIARKALGGSPGLSGAELTVMLDSRLAGIDRVIGMLLESGRHMLSADALEVMLTRFDGFRSAAVEQFTSRAQDFASVAALLVDYQRMAEVRRYVTEAVHNQLSHGWHKDMLLFHGLEVVEECGRIVPDGEGLLCRLAVPVASVDDFTDGDETGHLAERLGEALEAISPEKLPAYIEWLMSNEEYHRAESVLRHWLRTADLADPVINALAATCITPDDIAVLNDRASSGDQEASRLLQAAPRYSDTPGEATPPERAPLSATDWSATTTEPSRDRPLTALDFPPPAVSGFLEHRGATSYRGRGESISEWTVAWAQRGLANDALSAALPLLEEDESLGVSDAFVDVVRSSRGVTATYKWLVRAHQSAYGWLRYWGHSAEAEQRWGRIRADFPDRWHDFLCDSLAPVGSPWLGNVGASLVHIAKYLTLLGRAEEARALCLETVRSIESLVSAQALPVPSWVQSEDVR